MREVFAGGQHCRQHHSEKSPSGVCLCAPPTRPFTIFYSAVRARNHCTVAIGFSKTCGTMRRPARTPSLRVAQRNTDFLRLPRINTRQINIHQNIHDRPKTQSRPTGFAWMSSIPRTSVRALSTAAGSRSAGFGSYGLAIESRSHARDCASPCSHIASTPERLRVSWRPRGSR